MDREQSSTWWAGTEQRETVTEAEEWEVGERTQGEPERLKESVSFRHLKNTFLLSESLVAERQ